MNKLNAYALVSLLRALSRPWRLLGWPLGGAFREKVILRVSAVNSCFVCSAIHGAWAGIHDVPQEEIACVRTKRISEPRLRTALDYADVRTLNDRPGQEALQSPLAQHFTAAERAALDTVIDLYTFTNRFNNTWEGWLPGHRARRERQGITTS